MEKEFEILNMNEKDKQFEKVSDNIRNKIYTVFMDNTKVDIGNANDHSVLNIFNANKGPEPIQVIPLDMTKGIKEMNDIIHDYINPVEIKEEIK